MQETVLTRERTRKSFPACLPSHPPSLYAPVRQHRLMFCKLSKQIKCTWRTGLGTRRTCCCCCCCAPCKHIVIVTKPYIKTEPPPPPLPHTHPAYTPLSSQGRCRLQTPRVEPDQGSAQRLMQTHRRTHTHTRPDTHSSTHTPTPHTHTHPLPAHTHPLPLHMLCVSLS